MSKPGSHDYAASVAARRGLDAGLTRLGIALLAHVASRGVDFQTDAQIREELTRPDGRRYHRESIGRKRREITRSGLLSARRLYPGQKPPGAKFRTTHGVVVKSVVWSALRVPTPTARGARQQEAARGRLLLAELARRSNPPPSGRMTSAEVAEAAAAAQAALERPPDRPPD